MPHPLPRTIWTLWLQGWAHAPETAQACLASWRRLNPGWRVLALDRTALDDWLPAATLAAFDAAPKQPEALSDQIRVELLYRHGGVWADATAMCARPLDQWLAAHMPNGFFAFEGLDAERMLASWFLAAAPHAHIITIWRAHVGAYWRGRSTRDDYYWLHKSFAAAYAADPQFRRCWDETPRLPAAHRLHFGPDSERLRAPATSDDIAALTAPPSPVFKLTHKLAGPLAPDSLLEALHRFGQGNRA